MSNLSKDIGGEHTSKIIEGIIKRDMQPLVTSSTYNLLNQGILLCEQEFYQLSDLILVLGGDGTILQTSRQAAIYAKPLLGINLGRLGFMAEAELTDSDLILDAIRSGSYVTENRMMLQANLIRDGKKISEFIALNDIAIAKGSFARIIHLKAYINGEFVNCYPADGLLISSPTGSTAYSLSAGGPIIDPGMECLLLTPICPHTLNSRSIITNAYSRIEVVVSDKNRDILITIDGQEGTNLQEGDTVVITKSSLETHLIRLSGYGFFNLLRDKLTERIHGDRRVAHSNEI